ncbi:MAG TPA: prolyl oligopeptidase family serine peptidase, partial [Gemmataceae bacterium]|nr:prolyl oligopeptidase family serine peptidase [Gemmataceae bacterium]
MRICRSLLVLLALPLAALADGPGDNHPEKVRPVPPPGIKIPDADRHELQAGLDELGKQIDTLRTALKGKPALLDLLPDVQVYHKAVRYALQYDEFYKPAEISTAKALLKQGMERARLLREGKAPWTTATGLVVRGYVSKIDGSVQPYGLVVPASYSPTSPHQFRLDLWCHGRGETLTEVNFIADRERSPGAFTPPNAFVLHLYGRYCNANRFAGEVDCFEAMDNVKKHYPIDEDRVVMRGFSMGGAACWDFAVHYPSVWAAAAPGAGFSETADFLKVFQNETVQPTDYERKLWHWYDATDYALNLFDCPTVAYSGEIDRQKQAADMMAKALADTGLELTHIIGPKTAHAYEPRAKQEVSRRIDAIAARGRNPVPNLVRFTTWTLRYNRCFWVTIDGLKSHWDRAVLQAGRGGRPGGIEVRTGNIDALTLELPPGADSMPPARQREGSGRVIIDRTRFVIPYKTDRSLTAHFRQVDGVWKQVDSVDDGTLRKRHGLQGPIDDAFLSHFLMVRPTGHPLNEKVGAWAAHEMAHAIDHWRKQFRGDAPVRNDDAVTDADIADSNLILWGDPSSNKVLAKIADRLPIRWTAEGVRVGEKTYSAADHVPLLIYPNPLNPKRYVVLNSGFTFREYDYLNNARQVPKLPDWAVLDVSVPPSSQAPGRVVAADFFDERWQLKPAAK